MLQATEEERAMAEDSTATAPEQTTPTEDTSTAPPSDTAQNTQAAKQTVDWEARYKASQAELTRQAQERARAEQRLREIEAAAEPDEGDAGGDEPEPRSRRGRVSPREAELQEQLEREQWARAEAIYGGEVIGAYENFYNAYSVDSTPVGLLTALEAYYQARTGGASPAQAAAVAEAASAPTRDQAVQPRVDQNRPDVSPDPTLDSKLKEAQGRGEAGLKDFIGLQIERAGWFGRGRGSE